MRKSEFLKLLEKKLNILNESERGDILNEYRDTIEEKVKHGETEEKAVEDFGDIDELAKEILGAYKINPEFNSESDFTKKTKEVLKSGESWIKEGANKLADFSRKVADDAKHGEGLTLENIFEIIIKVFLVLLGLAVLRIIFMAIGHLLFGLFDFALFPIGGVFEVIWWILINIVYLVVCTLIVISVFSQYFDRKGTTNYKRETPKQTKKTEETEPSNRKEETKEETISKKKVVEEIEPKRFSVWTFIWKFFVTICAFIPLIFINIGIAVAYVIVIYLFFKGVFIWEILILLIGISIFWNYVTHLVSNLLFSRIRRVHIAPFIVSAVFITFGSIMTIDHLTQIEYYDTVPSNVNETTERYAITITDPYKIIIENGFYEMIVDPSLADNQIEVVYDYYQDLTKYEIKELNNQLRIVQKDNYDRYRFKTITNLVIDNLRHDDIYNYGKLYQVQVKIHTNEKTKSMITARAEW